MLSYAYALGKYKNEDLPMINQIVEHFGGVAGTARALGVSQPAVSQWLRDSHIPPARAVQIETLTQGQYKATDILNRQNR
jgi:DNA-binding transcriptional regulator YdaS (Cro superfamily)